MMAEFSIAPVGTGVSMSRLVAKVVDVVDRSGLDYRVGPMGTVVEGDFDAVMALIARCHKLVRREAPRVLTTIRIDDRKGATKALNAKVAKVEQLVGRRIVR